MNQRLPALKAKDVIRVVSRTSGSHCRMIHSNDPGRNVTVPVHNSDLKRGTLRSIIAQAGLTVSEFIALL
jgi:predicted RNA binding protein YcfA (HicA-like mRNA interferase family)